MEIRGCRWIFSSPRRRDVRATSHAAFTFLISRERFARWYFNAAEIAAFGMALPQVSQAETRYARVRDHHFVVSQLSLSFAFILIMHLGSSKSRRSSKNLQDVSAKSEMIWESNLFEGWRLSFGFLVHDDDKLWQLLSSFVRSFFF